MRIGIAGIGGRMGRLVADEVRASDLILVGGTVRPGSAIENKAGMSIYADLATLSASSDIVIDFTHAGTTQHHADILKASGTAWVLGITGLSAEQEKIIQAAANYIPIVQASNFSPAVTLMESLAQKMASVLPASEYDIEILEMHHRQKRDAPSGTAVTLGRAMATARGEVLEDIADYSRTSPRETGHIGFAVLRGGQVIGDHSIIFASATEHLSLNHHASDRRVFAKGALKAALWLQGQSAGLYSMRDVLGLE